MRTTSNIFVLVLVALFAMLVSFSCADLSLNPDLEVKVPDFIEDTKAKAKEPFSYKIDITNQNTIKLEGINGAVNVQSVSGTNQITISGEKIVRSGTYADAEENLEYLSIEIDRMFDKILVKTVQPEFLNGRSYNVNYTLSIPSHLNIFVENVNGKISGQLAVPMYGIVDLNLQNGSIDLDLPQITSADFSASLVNGSISLQNLTLHNRVETSKSLQGTFGDGQGTISLRTSNGNINVFGF